MNFQKYGGPYKTPVYNSLVCKKNLTTLHLDEEL